MNPLTIRTARRIRLGYQTELLYETDEDGRQVYTEEGLPAINTDQAPAVLAAFGVSPKLAGATLAGSQFSDVDTVRDWLVEVLNGDSTYPFALFLGDGSNYTAAAVLRNAVKRARTVAWYDWITFTNRYTDGITRARLLDGASPEERDAAAHETGEAADEDFRLRHVYEFLVITDFDINGVRDFAVPDIVSMIKNRCDFELITVITVAASDVDVLERDPRHFGGRAPLLRLFEKEAQVFDGRQ